MELTASKNLKILYCLCLVMTLVSMLLSGGWIGLVFGGIFPGSTLIWLVVVVRRIGTVIRNPQALDALSAEPKANFLRTAGKGFMVLGILGSGGMLLVRPITYAIFQYNTGEDGIAFFAVGMVLYLLSMSGVAGLGLFELGRRTVDKSANPTNTASHP
jgi:hypothetical protein